MDNFQGEVLKTLGEIKGDVRVLLEKTDGQDLRLHKLEEAHAEFRSDLDEVKQGRAFDKGRNSLISTIVAAIVSLIVAGLTYIGT